MVYSRIDIICAIKVPAKTFYVEFLGVDPSDYERVLEENGSPLYVVNRENFPNIYFGPPLCCRNDESFILVGVKVSTIWRRYVDCNECRIEHRSCNWFYSQTDHGFYDFDEYFEPIRECDPTGICPMCYYDNREAPAHIPEQIETFLRLARLRDTLWRKLPSDVFKIILNNIAQTYKIIRPKHCIRCNHRLEKRKWAEFNINPTLACFYDVRLIAKKHFKDKYVPKLYYVHDDCASCT